MFLHEVLETLKVHSILPDVNEGFRIIGLTAGQGRSTLGSKALSYEQFRKTSGAFSNIQYR